jgi:hypothetical protein
MMKKAVQERSDLAEQAAILDRQIRVAVTAMRRSLTELGRLLARMKESELWKHLPGRYRGWEDYARAVMGPRAHSSLYEVLAAHSLTLGVNQIPPGTVDKMGIKRAAQVARLKPEDRTPAVINNALNGSLPRVKHMVQEIINMDLPEEDRREPTVLFSRNLPAATADLMEEIELDGQFMEGMRDGDTSVSLRGKFWYYVMVNFRESHKAELTEGRKFRLALETRNDKARKGEAGQASDVEDDGPPDPEEFAAPAQQGWGRQG